MRTECWREIKPNIWLTICGSDEYAPGWYFADETQRFNGPFESLDEVERMFAAFLETL